MAAAELEQQSWSSRPRMPEAKMPRSSGPMLFATESSEWTELREYYGEDGLDDKRPERFKDGVVRFCMYGSMLLFPSFKHHFP